MLLQLLEQAFALYTEGVEKTFNLTLHKAPS